MKLKNTVKILMDTGNFKEVVGEYIPYEYKGEKFQLIVHESSLPWTPNVLDISEATTGCRCTSTNKTVSSSTKEDIIEAMNTFVQEKGLNNFRKQIQLKVNENLTR